MLNYFSKLLVKTSTQESVATSNQLPTTVASTKVAAQTDNSKWWLIVLLIVIGTFLFFALLTYKKRNKKQTEINPASASASIASKDSKRKVSLFIDKAKFIEKGWPTFITG